MADSVGKADGNGRAAGARRHAHAGLLKSVDTATYYPDSRQPGCRGDPLRRPIQILQTRGATSTTLSTPVARAIASNYFHCKDTKFEFEMTLRVLKEQEISL